MYDTATGQFFYTGSYGGGGGGGTGPITVSIDNDPSSAPDPEQSFDSDDGLASLHFDAGPGIILSQSSTGGNPLSTTIIISASNSGGGDSYKYIQIGASGPTDRDWETS